MKEIVSFDDGTSFVERKEKSLARFWLVCYITSGAGFTVHVVGVNLDFLIRSTLIRSDFMRFSFIEHYDGIAPPVEWI